MTPEFKEQNSIDVNGRLICKHFLADRCLKGEGCQFEHSRDLGGFKFHEVCKFYIQGFCMRGDSCLYMHSAFPCKFFHRGRGCQNQDSCRFSHAPLTELTERILDKFLEELKAKHQPLEPEPEPEPAADPLANTKTCEGFLANTKTLNFYSAAENSEPEPVRPFSFGANSAEFQPERPVSVLIPVPIAITISQQPTQSADHTDSPVQSGAASTSESQISLVEQGPAEQPERPTASNSTARPSSSSSTPSASSSSSSSASKDAQNLLRATAIERPQSPRTPDPPSTPSVLRNLFSHLSPCRSDYDNEDDDDDDGNIDGEEDEMTVKMKTELEGDATSNSTDPVPLLDATKFCTEVPREHSGAGSHSKASTPAAPDHQLGLITNPLPKSRNFVKEPQRHQHLVVPPPSNPPVPCSTPIASHLRKYRPLAVDLSPLPSLSLTAYHQTPQPHDATPGHLTSVADTQEAAPEQCVARSQGAGIKKTLTGELQGRHSLPVQSLSWANSSKCKDQKWR
ncbi:zinc finger CCCH domain-containing protein 6-like [Engraulis encrasicolus]|uniref:zinc finger CCCH domain-containing protein 6-like n=1 Tax=Engraulis encrasicolus TaxID=184585 RepID=UPI002FD44F22